MNRLTRIARSQQGFTLTELLVVITILSVMLAGLLSVQMTGQTTYLIGAHRVEAQQNARIALELMVRELRSAASVTAVSSATSLTFVDENNSVIQYELAGRMLNRTATGCATCTGVATPVIGGVQTFALTYYKTYDGATNTGLTTTVANQVTLVRVQLVTGTEESVASYSPSNQQSRVETLVRLRNI
jgi:prepilin-type N-terminal cleavage/methylation domain-containing protein